MFKALLLLVAPLLTASSHPRVLVMSISAGEGVTGGTAQALTASVLGEVRKRPGFAVMSPDDVQAVLSVERQKQLLGCSEGNCLVDIGGALGVDRIVTGSVAKIGESWLLHVQLVDAKNAAVLRSSDRRKKNGSIDDLLDELPKMVDELFGAAPARVAQADEPPPLAQAAVPAPKAIQLPSPLAAEPATLAADVRAKLHVVTDGNGRYLAFVPFDLDAPLFAGDVHALGAQSTFGGGANGTQEFDRVFWEPRQKPQGHGTFEFRDGKYTLDCGQGPRELHELAPKKAQAFLKKAKLLAFRWKRQAMALGRDDDGTYYLVDAPRSDGNLDDAHLYMGARGQMIPVAVRDTARAGARLQLLSQAGKLELPLGDLTETTPAGSFKAGGEKKTVAPMDLWQSRALIYAGLGVYPKQLGTACDPEYAK